MPSIGTRALAAVAFSISVVAQMPTVSLDQGSFVGTTTMVPGASQSAMKFLGMPFASQVERWAAPQPVPTSPVTLDATIPRAACIQQFSGTGMSRQFVMSAFNNPPPAESEDCLSVNVYTPSMDGSRPVMVWLYGGGLAFGSNALPTYDGSSLAANQDVVVVAPNYRTNGVLFAHANLHGRANSGAVFGFPGNVSMIAQEERNLGFLDQRMALDWTQQNIARFGGDPDKVTIFGESAGAASVDLLLLTMEDNPPFRAAILQSGVAGLAPRGFSTSGRNSSDESSFMQLASAVGCNGNEQDQALMDCMMRVPATEYVSFSMPLPTKYSCIVQNQASHRGAKPKLPASRRRWPYCLK